MSIRCNLGAPREVPREVIELLLAADPDITDLKRRFKELYTKLKSEYKFIKRAPKGIKEKHDDLRKQLRNAKKNLKDKIKKAYRSDYFFCIHNEMIKRQLNKSVVEEEVKLVVKHQLEEQTQLQEILCDFSKGLSP
jgi:tRNA(Glu) U13 pseudouridine synthase TruD